MQKPTQALKPIKDPGNTFDLNPRWERTLMSVGNLSWDIYRVPQKISKYQCWYLTPCCGNEVQKPTQAPKSVKDPKNTFDLNPKWERTLPSVGNCSWDIYRVPQKISKYQSWYLTPCCRHEVQKSTQTIKTVKDLGNTFELNPKWERTFPSLGNCSWDMYSVSPPKIFQISKLIFDTLLWAWGAETHPGT
jgi:hypothetical protein